MLTRLTDPVLELVVWRRLRQVRFAFSGDGWLLRAARCCTVRP